MSHNRRLWIIGVVVLGLTLLALLFAPRTAPLSQGSTYSRAPSGYGAWYAYMQQQGIPIQRWQRPLTDLMSPSHPIDKTIPISLSSPSQGAAIPKTPIVLVQIYPKGSTGLERMLSQEWFRQGNVLVILGVQVPVSQAPFRSKLDSPLGAVSIATSRRYLPPSSSKSSDGPYRDRLKDKFGMVVWQTASGKGGTTYIVTPYLAANAYQHEPGNFKFLQQLVTEPGLPIYVDEYLHGYKDQVVLQQEHTPTLLTYLAKTPLLLITIQAGVILSVLIWAHNRRFGPPVPLANLTVDNSEAYIRALATVLLKANCSEFVVETIGQAERLHVQRSLGLGMEALSAEALLAAWQQQIGQPSHDLEQLLALTAQPRRLNERELRVWLGQVKTVRQQLAQLRGET